MQWQILLSNTYLQLLYNIFKLLYNIFMLLYKIIHWKNHVFLLINWLLYTLVLHLSLLYGYDKLLYPNILVVSALFERKFNIIYEVLQQHWQAFVLKYLFPTVIHSFWNCNTTFLKLLYNNIHWKRTFYWLMDYCNFYITF